MRILLTPEQMRKVDSRAINEFSVPGSILMENAALNSTLILSKIFAESGFENPSIIALCGSGNNGGDGFAIARQLMNFCSVKILWIGDESKMSEETRQNFNICKKLGLSLYHIKDLKHFDRNVLNSDCIIDALIGVGGSENIKGIALELLKLLKDYTGLKISIDVPTGLNSENGLASEYTFKANYTITMFAPKTGMYLNKGFDYCGHIKIANLGLPLTIADRYANNFMLDYESARIIMPVRKKISSKFDYGKVVILAGSKQYPGAAALTANAAIKSGAGLVYLLSTSFHPNLLPEIIQVELDSNSDGTISMKSKNKIEDFIEKADSIVIGPGLSNNLQTIEFVVELINHFSKNKKIILDADGLRAVKPDLELSKNIILTPHTGELKRIIGNFQNDPELKLSSTEEYTNYYDLLNNWSKKLNCIIHLKWVPSITTDGQKFFWNTFGNPGMASAGSGDVLSGIIGGLLAQGINTLECAALGSFIHSRAGDIAAKKIGLNYLSASNLLDYLSMIFKSLES